MQVFKDYKATYNKWNTILHWCGGERGSERLPGPVLRGQFVAVLCEMLETHDTFNCHT